MTKPISSAIGGFTVNALLTRGCTLPDGSVMRLKLWRSRVNLARNCEREGERRKGEGGRDGGRGTGGSHGVTVEWPDGLHTRIHRVVSRIPRGRVATYGEIARLAGLHGQARLVGYALHALPVGTRIPWQRVVNAQGAISLPGKSAIRQRELLEKEGVRFDARGRIDLDRFLWQPRPTSTDTSG